MGVALNIRPVINHLFFAIYYIHQTELSLSDCFEFMAREMKVPCLTRKADISRTANVLHYASVYVRRQPLKEKHLLKSHLGLWHR